MFDSDLPLVRQSLPWPLRLLLIALGLFVAGLPLWELGRALWPPNIVTPFFGIIIAGAAGIGFKVVATGLNGEGLEWRYPPGAVVVRRSSWRKHRETRLTAANVAAVEVRGGRSMDGDGVWRVVIVPKPSDSGLLAASRSGRFEAGDYGSEQYAQRVRDALLEHLHMRDAGAR